MTMEEAIKLAKKHCGTDTQAIATVIAGQLIAESMTEVAEGTKRQADAAVETLAMTKGMTQMMAPMMEGTADMMNKMKEDMEDGEDWKRGLDD